MISHKIGILVSSLLASRLCQESVLRLLQPARTRHQVVRPSDVRELVVRPAEAPPPGHVRRVWSASIGASTAPKTSQASETCKVKISCRSRSPSARGLRISLGPRARECRRGLALDLGSSEARRLGGSASTPLTHSDRGRTSRYLSYWARTWEPPSSRGIRKQGRDATSVARIQRCSIHSFLSFLFSNIFNPTFQPISYF